MRTERGPHEALVAGCLLLVVGEAALRPNEHRDVVSVGCCPRSIFAGELRLESCLYINIGATSSIFGVTHRQERLRGTSLNGRLVAEIVAAMLTLNDVILSWSTAFPPARLALAPSQGDFRRTHRGFTS